MIKIAVVEDQENIALLITNLLKQEGLGCSSYLTGQEAIENIINEKPDLILLDKQLPDIDGFEICKKIKSEKCLKKVPVIFLTCRTDKDCEKEGLKLGADDYIKKPFENDLLILRIKAVLKRTYDIDIEDGIIKIGRFVFNFQANKVRIGRKTIQMNTKEIGILYLLSKEQETVSKDTIFEKVWGAGEEYNIGSLEVYIHNLRKKLEEFKSIQIQTIPGKGYNLVA